MGFHKKFKFSFVAKLFIWFSIISIVPVIILGTLVFTISSRVSMTNVETQGLETVDKAGESLRRTISEYESALSYFCNDNEIIDMISVNKVTDKSQSSIYQKMYILLAGKPNTLDMHLIKSDGTFNLSTSKIPEVYSIKDHSDWGVFRKLNSSDNTIKYSNRYISQSGKSYCMAIAHNIKKNGVVIGYAIIDIPTEVFERTLSIVNLDLPVKYTVLDENYYIIYDEIFNLNSKTFLDNDFKIKIEEDKTNSKLYLENPKRVITWNKSYGDYPITILSSVSVELVKISSSYITVTTIAVAIGAIILCLILSPLIIFGLTKPLNAIIETMDKVENGDKKARVVTKNKDEFGFIGTRMNSMLDNLNELFQKDLEKQDRLRLSEMKSLHSQINPHFLYNTLDSIKWLAKLNGVDDIVLIVSQLGRLLKNSINNQRDSVQISEEIGLVKSYLSIQKIRYGDKFDVDIYVDESIMECIVPKLIIQPIVENAIIHGIEDKMSKAHLVIRGWKENKKIIFEIIDDGVGISEEDLLKIGHKSEDELGSDSIGLANVDKRIKLYYGEEYGLGISSELNIGTVTRITMPYVDTADIKDERQKR